MKMIKSLMLSAALVLGGLAAAPMAAQAADWSASASAYNGDVKVDGSIDNATVAQAINSSVGIQAVGASAAFSPTVILPDVAVLGGLNVKLSASSGVDVTAKGDITNAVVHDSYGSSVSIAAVGASAVISGNYGAYGGL